jgi:hypothetical protein
MHSIPACQKPMLPMYTSMFNLRCHIMKVSGEWPQHEPALVFKSHFHQAGTEPNVK